jgi:hypothetical protein
MMRKAIYLNVEVHVTGADGPDQAIIELVKDTVGKTLEAGTAGGLTGEVKRARLAPPIETGVHSIDVLVYVRGEQEAAQSFTTLSVSDTQASLNKCFESPLTGNIRASLGDIEENTNAVEELDSPAE